MLYNLSVLELMGDNDPEFIKSLISVFVESIPPDLEILNVAADNHDWEQVSFMAHKIKSTIDNLSVDSLKQIVRMLEAKSVICSLSTDDILSYVKEVTYILSEVIIEMRERYPHLS